MGRPAKPAAVRAQLAPVRSRAKEPEAVQAEGLVPESVGRAPGWLKGEALELWNKRAPQLRAARLLTSADELTFARYCYNFARWRTERAKMDRKGYTYDATTVTGGKLRRVDPSFMIADRLERMLLAVEDRFGMNPAERQRIFLARAQGKGAGLFDEQPRQSDPATPASGPAKPIVPASGFLN